MTQDERRAQIIIGLKLIEEALNDSAKDNSQIDDDEPPAIVLARRCGLTPTETITVGEGHNAFEVRAYPNPVALIHAVRGQLLTENYFKPQ